MKIKDIFIFEKGERMALTVLLALALLSFVKFPSEDSEAIATEEARQPVLAVFSTDTVTSRPPISIPEPPKKVKKKAYQERMKSNKLSAGQKVDLNLCDTTLLKQVPGIGSSFAKRIVGYRDLLGGYHKVEQLMEVYGLDEDKYHSLKEWFVIENGPIATINVNNADFKSILRHPYINKEQTKEIFSYRNKNIRIDNMEQLSAHPLFTDSDVERLTPYLSFD
jgi:DNA uptake protein ComE-like DNA-binding protein